MLGKNLISKERETFSLFRTLDNTNWWTYEINKGDIFFSFGKKAKEIGRKYFLLFDFSWCRETV